MSDQNPRRPVHPALFTFLIAPFGITSGFISVALVFLATREHLSVEQGASLIAVSMFPNMWKFLWAPVSDKTLSRKRWHLIGTVLGALGVFALSVMPLTAANLVPVQALIVFVSLATTFVGFSTEALMAHLTPAEERGRVSGWFQAGNLGGGGLGGGLGLWLLNSLPSTWMAGALLAGLMILCAWPLLVLPDIGADGGDEGPLAAARHVAADLWSMLRSRDGFLCGALCVLPVGTGAATGMLTQAEVASTWSAGAHEVELVQGVLTGLLSMAGCLAGGWICSKGLRPRVAYAAFGVLMALVSASMAFMPATVATYVSFGLGYAFVTGLCFAAFSGFVLDAIGEGHVATKYSGFASLSNTPIWYTGLVLAEAQTRFGARGMLLTEAALGVGGVALFALCAWTISRRPSAEPAIT